MNYNTDGYGKISCRTVLGQLPIFSGPFNLLEQKVYVTEGMRACQAYGKAVGEKLNG